MTLTLTCEPDQVPLSDIEQAKAEEKAATLTSAEMQATPGSIALALTLALALALTLTSQATPGSIALALTLALTLTPPRPSQLSEELDDVKKMNQMMLYAKVVTIRDAQAPPASPLALAPRPHPLTLHPAPRSPLTTPRPHPHPHPPTLSR